MRYLTLGLALLLVACTEVQTVKETVEEVHAIAVDEAEDQLCQRLRMREFLRRYSEPETYNFAYWAFCAAIQHRREQEREGSI